MSEFVTGLPRDTHLLLLADGVAGDEVEALVISLVLGARWTQLPHEDADRGYVPGILDLLAGDPAATADPSGRARLIGPLVLARESGAFCDLPPWATQAFLLDVEPHRSEIAAPSGNHGELVDAFGEHHPVGIERQVLDVANACARRLAGALYLVTDAPKADGATAGSATGTVLVPDPISAVDLAVHAPTWLEPEALEHVLEPVLPGLRVQAGFDASQVLDGYGTSWPLDDAGELLMLEVEAAEILPPAVRFAPWATGGVISYWLRWHPADGDREPATRGGRRRRDSAREAIERAAAALHAAVGGEILDEDGFLVDLSLEEPGGDGPGAD